MGKLISIALFAVALVVAIVLLLAGRKRLRVAKSSGVAGMFLVMVNVILASLSPAEARPVSNTPGIRATTAALLKLYSVDYTEWMKSDEWKAVVEFCEMLKHQSSGRGTDYEEMTGKIEKWDAQGKALIEDLKKLTAAGVMPAELVEVVEEFVSDQLYHLKRMMATCYTPVAIEQRVTKDLNKRIALLERLHKAGTLNQWLFDNALGGLGSTLRDAERVASVKDLSDKAWGEVLAVKRILDETRLKAVSGTDQWKAIRADVRDVFAQETPKVEIDVTALEKNLAELVDEGLLNKDAAFLFRAVINSVAAHNWQSGPLAPSCYKPSQRGIDLMDARKATRALAAAMIEGKEYSDEEWAEKLSLFTDLLLTLVYEPDNSPHKRDDLHFVLWGAEVFDLLVLLQQP